MIKQLFVSNVHAGVDTLFLSKKEINSIITVIDPQRAAFVELFHKQIPDINTSRFYFYDVSEPECPKAPELNTIHAILKTILDLHKSSKEYNCLIHCYAGRQRSTAIAYIALAFKHDFNYKMALDELFLIRKKAFPNAYILELADKILYTQLEKNFYNYIYTKKIVRKYNNHYINYIKENNL